MRHFFVALLVFLCCSCEYFNVKKTSSEAILKEDLKTFNWNDVDTYPSFANCDSLTIKQEQKGCFESTLYFEISEFLEKQNIVVTQDINDTLHLKLKISNKGEITLIEAKIDTLTKMQIPEIEVLLAKGVKRLPEIHSATKQGQPVTTEFEMPVIIKVN